MKKYLGQFQYTAPAWLKSMMAFFAQTKMGQKLGFFFATRKTNPKLFYKKVGVGVLALLMLVTAQHFISNWWQSRPKPELVTFKITKPYLTSPETKRAEALVISFSKSVARLEDLNSVIKDRVTLDPKIEGTWSWQTDSNLVFTPDYNVKADWKVGTKYEVEFKKTLFADHIKLEKYSEEWTSRALEVSVIGSEFFIDPKDPRIKKTITQVGFTHPVRAEDLQAKLDVSIAAESGLSASKKLNYTVVFNQWNTFAYIHSEALTIDDRPQTVSVKLAKGLKAKQEGEKSESSFENKISVPGRLTAFKIESGTVEIIRNQKYEPEQILLIRTSLQAKSEDVAKKLKIKLLPKDKPATDGEKEIKDYQWSGVTEVTNDILKSSTEVPFTLVPSADVYSKVHSFRISTQPKQSILFQIDKGVKSLGDFELADDYSSIALVKPYPEEISVMSEGSLLSLSGELKVPLMARNAHSVEVTLSRILPEQVNHLLSQLSYDITKPYLEYDFQNKTAEMFTSEIPLNLESAKATQFFSFDLGPYLIKNRAPKGIFLLKAKIRRPDRSYGPEDQRLIMVTDLGLIVKETHAETHEVFAQNIRSGLPAAGATIEVIGRNGLTVLSVQTDAQGHATFPNLKDYQYEKQPIAFSVKSGLDQSFLPFRNSKQNLQYSRFDVGGLYEAGASEQMMSMIFSDRGIYRPGELVNLGLIVRSKSTKLKGQKIPLQINVRDPKGNEVLTQKILVNPDDLKSANFKTEETAPTGIYEVTLSLIKKNDQLESIGSQTVRIEEFQPDRIKIRSSLSQEKLAGWIKVQDLKGFVSLRNLFGTAAEDRLVRAKMVLTPQQPNFKGFEGYKFIQFDQSQIESQTDELPEQRTNSNGETEFALNLKRYTSPYFVARFEAEGFEADAGRSVRATSSVMLSTLDFMVGAKPDGDLEYIHKDSVRNVQLIAVDSDLKKVAANQLTVEVIERKFVSVLTQSESGAFKYQSVAKETLMSTESLNFAATGHAYKIKTDLPGDFILVIKNKENVELLKLPYTIAGAANIARSLDRHTELQLILNKKDFRAGEEIELQIKAPYKGAGLISIERDGIYQYKWFKSETSATVQRIKVPDGLTGNAYVHVTFLRAIDSSEIFMSPLSYAVAPFSISLDDRKTHITLKVPEKIKPGQTLKIQYSTQAPTKLILYGVDEGILQVARYKLPDPLGFFFQKRALQVKTYQMLDLIMPEFSLIQQSQAPGGDEGSAIGKNLNPFKSKRAAPIAFWSDVLDSGPQAKTFTYEVPDYFNGNIKVMAVAADPKNLGSAETSTFVRGDFIISPSVPVFIAPLDEMVIGLSVSNQKEKSGAGLSVKLTAQANALLEVTKNADQILKIDEGKEVATSISIKAKNQVGEGQVTFTAQADKASVKAKADISVRPIVPFQNKILAGWSNKWPLDMTETTRFFEPFSKKIVTASASPLALGVGLQNYLESQPYGCTEQLVSKVFPSVALFNYYEKNKKQNDKMKDSIASLVRILRSRQMSDGGFALYESLSGSSHPAASLHAILILIELNDRKLAQVTDMLTAAKSYLTSVQVSPNNAGTPPSIASYQVWAQALYLSARMKVVNGASLSALKQELNQLYKKTWHDDLTALFVAATSKLYKQDEQAEELFKDFKLVSKTSPSEYSPLNYFDPLSKSALLIYLSALHSGESYKKILEGIDWSTLTTALNQNLHTFSASYLLMAFEAMEQRSTTVPAVTDLKMASAPNTWTDLAPTQSGKFTSWNVPLNVDKVQLSSTSNFPLFYSYQNSGFASDAKLAEVKEKVEVVRQFHDQGGKTVSAVKIGEEVDVTLAIRSTDEKIHANVAIVDLLPGGFELIPQRNLNRLDSGNSEEQAPIDGEPQEQFREGEGSEEAYPSHEDEGAFFKFPLEPLLFPKAYAQTVTTQLAQMDADFIDQRDDRVVIYASVRPEVQYFKYKIKAVAEGRFQIPPAFAEGMYDRNLRFVGPSGWIEIKSAK